MNDLVETLVSELREQGFAIRPSVVSADAMEATAAELRPHFDVVDLAATTNRTKRLHSGVLAQNVTLQALIMHPLVLAVMDELLLENCAKYQLSSVQGIEVHGGGTDQTLHRDDDIFRLPHPHPTFEVNVMWAVTDFSSANGATRVVPGSHTWPSGRVPEGEATVAAEIPQGSLLFWLGSTWHGAGANTTDDARVGLYAGYSLGWLRQEETLYLALPPEVVAPMPETLQRLIGYEIKGTSTLGWLDGRDPREVLGWHSRT